MTLARITLLLRVTTAVVVLAALVIGNRAPQLRSSDSSLPLPFIPVDTGAIASAMATADRNGATDVDLDAIVNSNIFSPTRRAPTVRYQPSEFETVGDAVTPMPIDSMAAPGTAGDPTAVGTTDTGPKLFGTMRDADGAIAMLRLDARRTEPQLYRVGDRAGGFRVVRIDDHAVILSGSSGTVTLRLARPDQEVP